MGRNIIFCFNAQPKQRLGKAGVKEARGALVVLAKHGGAGLGALWEERKTELVQVESGKPKCVQWPWGWTSEWSAVGKENWRC